MPGASSWTRARQDASTATRRCVAPAASTKRSTPVACRPSMQIEPAPASGSRAPKQNAAAAVPACSFSSRSTAASAREPESARLASAVGHIGAGHAARPSSAITTRISRRPPSSRPEPSAATPCPTSLRQIAEISSADGPPFTPPAPNAPRETRAGNPEASRRYRRSEARSHPCETMPDRISACASP